MLGLDEIVEPDVIRTVEGDFEVRILVIVGCEGSFIFVWRFGENVQDVVGVGQISTTV